MPRSSQKAPSSTPYSWAPPGARVGSRFQIVRLISTGGMGVVYRGIEVGSNRPVAIKLLRREYAGNSGAKTRFLREARLLGRFRGQHLPRVLDVGEYGEAQLYIVLELIEGPDLRVALNQAPFDVTTAVNVVVQVAAALSEAHEQGIVHRDIKPENVVFAGPPGPHTPVKLIDFGIAREGCSVVTPAVPSKPLGDAFVMAERGLGSREYMAPEQRSTPERVDQRADIWSIGVLLFELLSGAAPVGDAAFLSLPVGVPAPLMEIVRTCLAPQVEDRFSDVADLVAQLSPFASGPLRDAVAPLIRGRAVRQWAIAAQARYRSPAESGVFIAPTVQQPVATRLEERVPTLDVAQRDRGAADR